MFRITHQFIEMDFRGGHKRSDAATALDESFPFERDKRVARGHQADLMNLRQVTFRVDGVTRTQMAGFDALADATLDSLVRGEAIAFLRWHSHSRIGPRPLRGHLLGSWIHIKNDILLRLSHKLRKCAAFEPEATVL
jgi:hypothetical protein